MGEDVDAALRVRDYLDMRKIGRRGMDPEIIHGLDVGPDTGAVLLASDIQTLLACMPASTQNAVFRKTRRRLVDDDE